MMTRYELLDFAQQVIGPFGPWRDKPPEGLMRQHWLLTAKHEVLVNIKNYVRTKNGGKPLDWLVGSWESEAESIAWEAFEARRLEWVADRKIYVPPSPEQIAERRQAQIISMLQENRRWDERNKAMKESGESP